MEEQEDFNQLIKEERYFDKKDHHNGQHHPANGNGKLHELGDDT